MRTISIITLSFALLSFSACTASTKEKSNQEKIENSEESTSLNNTGKVIHLSKAEFLEKVMNYEKNTDKWVYEGDKPCVIDFYADWCRPCKVAGPVLEELAKEYADEIIVYKIDTQKEKELAGAFGIQSIPAFLWVPLEGKPQMSNGIAKSPEETKEMFKQIIDDLLL